MALKIRTKFNVVNSMIFKSENHMLLVANLSHTIGKSQYRQVLGQVISVRFIVDQKGKRVGCGFVDLASAEEATMAVQEKNGAKLFVSVAEIAREYPF